MSDDPTTAELTAALRQLAWTLRRGAPSQEKVPPVPTSELVVLKQVLATPGATVNELSQSLGLQRSNTSAALRSLALRGLVVRSASAQDRRRAVITPTPRAYAEAAVIGSAWNAVVAEATARLSAAESAALLAAVPALRSLDSHVRVLVTPPVDED